MIIGVDEVGRGPGAGPIVFCAFALLDQKNDEKLRAEILKHFPKGKLRDSKKLSEKKREELSEYFHTLKEKELVTWTLAERSAEQIDKMGLSLCIKECLEEIMLSLHKLLLQNETSIKHEDIYLKLDGGLKMGKEYIQETIIKGDEKILEIACASIIAKVFRDTFMKSEALHFPEYHFEKNKGYLTKEHITLIKKCGVTELHRTSFLKNFKI